MFQLIILNKKVTTPKKKNTGYDDPTASITKGVAIMLMEQPNQFIKVAGGTNLAGMI